jgi:hypothetical protein
VKKALTLDMQKPPPLDSGFTSLGEVTLAPDDACVVTLSATDAGGFVHADAIQLLPVK